MTDIDKSIILFKDAFKNKMNLEILNNLTILRESMLDELDSFLAMDARIKDTKDHDDILKWADDLFNALVNVFKCQIDLCEKMEVNDE